MKVDPDTCRDADLLAAEVRRLQAVIAAGEPTLTDAERDAVSECYEWARVADHRSLAATLRGLLERSGGGGCQVKGQKNMTDKDEQSIPSRPEAIDRVARDMIEILRADGSDADDKDAAAETLLQAIWPASARPVRPGYILGDHWLEVAYERICAGDREEEVMDDYGWVRLTREERNAIWMVAEAYGGNDGDPECERLARIMHGLWQRTK